MYSYKKTCAKRKQARNSISMVHCAEMFEWIDETIPHSCSSNDRIKWNWNWNFCISFPLQNQQTNEQTVRHRAWELENLDFIDAHGTSTCNLNPDRNILSCFALHCAVCTLHDGNICFAFGFVLLCFHFRERNFILFFIFYFYLDCVQNGLANNRGSTAKNQQISIESII